MSNRTPGLVGTAIRSDLWCGLIADTHHVSRNMMEITLAARPRLDRMMLVSDAMSTVGGPDRFELYGETISVRDGRLVNAEGSLAGAHVTLAQCLENVLALETVDETAAVAMATSAPMEMMRLEGLVSPQSHRPVIFLESGRS